MRQHSGLKTLRHIAARCGAFSFRPSSARLYFRACRREGKAASIRRWRPCRLTYTRTLFIFPGVNTVKDPDAVVPPLTKTQKYQIFWRRTFDRSLPLEALFFAGVSQSINYSPRYGQGWGPFAERFGSFAGSIASTSFFADAFLPSLLHQDPRYFRKGRGSFGSRLLNSLESAVITHNDNGTTTFNTSGMLGFGMSTALSNAWAPRHSITFSDTMQRLAIKFVISSSLNLFREFGGHTPPPQETLQSH